jgi:hypothetical protein
VGEVKRYTIRVKDYEVQNRGLDYYYKTGSSLGLSLRYVLFEEGPEPPDPPVDGNGIRGERAFKHDYWKFVFESDGRLKETA